MYGVSFSCLQKIKQQTKEEEEMPLKGEMLPEEEEIRLEFLEMFQEMQKKRKIINLTYMAPT